MSDVGGAEGGDKVESIGVSDREVFPSRGELEKLVGAALNRASELSSSRQAMALERASSLALPFIENEQLIQDLRRPGSGQWPDRSEPVESVARAKPFLHWVSYHGFYPNAFGMPVDLTEGPDAIVTAPEAPENTGGFGDLLAGMHLHSHTRHR